jgi:ADP-heptose:LPS heptosyltransferase
MRQHQFFSLQKNADLAKFPRQCLLDLEQYASDVRDTAALILHLDLVITVDTMTAHLAGALGRPVWILLRHASDWRWMLDRRDTPWYPTARLFRQQRPGHWTLVIAEVMLALGSESR